MKTAFVARTATSTCPRTTPRISGSASRVSSSTPSPATGGIDIVNGMDPTEWNPETDKFLDVTYDKNFVAMGKAAAKQALQAGVGLP